MTIKEIEELEAKRHDLYADYNLSIGKPEEKGILRKLDEIDEVLDAVEAHDAEEEADTATHWDEYILDLRIDMAREDALSYER